MNLDIKYRPKNFEEFIGNTQLVNDVQVLLKVGDMPHFMFVGPPGCGKTTLELLIARYYLKKDVKISTEAGVSDFFVINASDERGIDVIRDVVKLHAKMRSETMDDDGNRLKRIIAIREADSLTRDAQHALRDIVEKYEDRCIFIFTLNHIEGIKEPALISRCYTAFLKRPTREQCAEFFLDIAEKEDVHFEDPEIVLDIADFYKGDLRHMLNDCLEVLRGLEGYIRREDLWKVYQSSNKSVAIRVYDSQNPRGTFFQIFREESFDIRQFLEEYYDLLGDESLEVSKAFAIVDARLRDNCSEIVQMNYLFSLLESVKK